MTIQTENGCAFEWVVGVEIAKSTGFIIKSSNFSIIAQKAYNSINQKKQLEFIKAAQIAIEHILRKEAKSLTIERGGTIEFNSGAAGQKGDVRDILIKAKNTTIGISCKTNHQALKHPRLSGSLDFVKKWGLDVNGCSPEYWTIVKPIFAELKKIRIDSNKTALWKDLSDKSNKYY